MNGLFGNPSPDWRQALPQIQQMQQKPQQPSGMFGRRGVDIGQLGAMILAANGNPLGQLTLQQRAQQQQSQDELKQRHLQREQDMGDRWSMWQRQQDYQRQNPQPRQPTQTDRYVEEVLNPSTDPRRRSLLQTILTRPIQVYNPQTGAMEWEEPGVGDAPEIVTDPTGWTPIEDDEEDRGGNAPGNF